MTEGDIRSEMLELMKKLDPQDIAAINASLRDALVSAARGEPSHYPINEMVHISQEEAQRICQKIGLDWDETSD